MRYLFYTSILLCALHVRIAGVVVVSNANTFSFRDLFLVVVVKKIVVTNRVEHEHEHEH